MRANKLLLDKAPRSRKVFLMSSEISTELEYAQDAAQWFDISAEQIVARLHTPKDVDAFNSILIAATIRQPSLEHYMRDNIDQFITTAKMVETIFRIPTRQRVLWSTPYLQHELTLEIQDNAMYREKLEILESYIADPVAHMVQNTNDCEDEIKKSLDNEGTRFYLHNTMRTQEAIKEITSILRYRGINVLA